MEDVHSVVVVVDPDCGAAISELAQTRHVWVVRSAANDAVVARLREEEHQPSLEAGVSTFNASPTPEDSLLSILGVVEEHHGVYSHDPPVSVIEVIGVEPTAAVREELAAYGFERIERAAGRFIAYR